MAKYNFELTISGRVNITVEADSPEEAENLAYAHPDFPNLDKVYDMELTNNGEI